MMDDRLSEETGAAAGTARRSDSGLARLQRWLLPIGLLVCLWKLVVTLGEAAGPVREWLFWRYLGYWALAAFWSASCFSFGHALLRRIVGPPLPVLEHVTLSFATGVLGFFTLMFAGGLAMAYGPVFFVALPSAMLAFGALPSLRYLRRLRRHLAHSRRSRPRPFRLGSALLWGLGTIALFLFYIPALVPSHIGYDSAWYHVPIAEHYASLGGVRPFPEGWTAGAIAHLPSFIYAWAFQLPYGTLFDRVELSAHLEFACALMTLPGIPALVRRLVPGARAHASWVALFAFPSLYWYDLLIGGDQISALWSAPIALGLLRTYPALSPRYGMLLAIGVAGETVTKYSAVGILILPALAVGLRMLWLPARALLRGAAPRVALRPLLSGLAIGFAVLLLTTPLWLKNWAFYGDPLHPVLNEHFASRPWTPDAQQYYADYMAELAAWQPARTAEGVKETLAAVVNHAFAPADFAINPKGPYRGALFTLLCLCLPLVPASRRLWGTALLANTAVLGWYWQSHQDRYLMAFMPVMAAVLVAIALLAMRSSVPARAALWLLIGVHSVWGLGVFTLSAPQRHYDGLLDFIVAAKRQGIEAGMSSFAGWQAIGKIIPEDGKLLIHQWHTHTGIGRMSVSDWPRTQTGLSYGRYASAADMYRGLRALGVTHMAWSRQNWNDDSIAGDLRFYEFGVKYTSPVELGGLLVGKLPDAPPKAQSGEAKVAFFACNERYKPGLYPFSALTVPGTRIVQPLPYPEPQAAFTPATDVTAAIAGAQYVVWNPDCGFARPSTLSAEFQEIGTRGPSTLYARREP